MILLYIFPTDIRCDEQGLGRNFQLWQSKWKLRRVLNRAKKGTNWVESVHFWDFWQLPKSTMSRFGRATASMLRLEGSNGGTWASLLPRLKGPFLSTIFLWVRKCVHVANFGALTGFCAHLAAHTFMFSCASFKIKIQIIKYVFGALFVYVPRAVNSRKIIIQI